MTGQTATRHRHLRALSLLLGVFLIATPALWSPYRTALTPHLASNILATGIAATATATGVRSDSGVAASRHRHMVSVGQGTGPATATSRLTLIRPGWSSPGSGRSDRPTHGDATLRHRGRAPPGHR